MSIKIFKNTDVDLTINVTGIDVADITAMSISLEPQSGAAITFTLADGSITKVGDSVNLRIEDNLLSVTGSYALRITATESGNIRGLTSNPEYILVV
ncbi:MAG: hypothetical protein K2Q13_04115 [Nitrosomonas sp.]|uniref:hypothetical protein n=1 Tax=Nitrosomonas sp. TaxID=42353 RepID=UPI0025CE1BB9|nr:hypothetical protein [Nitrosomonas sp.]MBY0474233.1 hypothetical protein [Nitrosomonas sp.]